MLDWKTLEYHPAAKPNLPSLEMAKNAERLPDRLAQLLSGDIKKDKAARFHWRLLSALWNYAAECLPEIADRRRQRGPRHARRLQLGNGPVRTVGCGGRAADGRRAWMRLRRTSSACSPPAPRPGTATTAANASTSRPPSLPAHRRSRKAWRGWPPSAAPNGRGAAKSRRVAGGSRRWRGLPGTAFQEERHRRRHRPHGDRKRCAPMANAVRNFEAFVIGGDADQFSVGANLMQLLLARAGRRVGRYRPDGAGVPAHDLRHQVLPAAGGGRAVRLLPGRRRGNRAGGRAAAGARGACTWGWWKPASACCPPAAAARR